MAYRVAISSLTEDQRKSIVKLLTLTPKESSNFDVSRPKPPPVKFFTVENGYLSIPYTFAASFFNIVPNMGNDFKKCPFDFTGTLRDYQIPICQEASQQLNNNGVCGLYLSTGQGKSACGAEI